MMTIGSNVQPRSEAKATTARAKAPAESVSKPRLKPFLQCCTCQYRIAPTIVSANLNKNLIS
jgi:hypothetical protein